MSTIEVPGDQAFGVTFEDSHREAPTRRTVLRIAAGVGAASILSTTAAVYFDPALRQMAMIAADVVEADILPEGSLLESSPQTPELNAQVVPLLNDLNEHFETHLGLCRRERDGLRLASAWELGRVLDLAADGVGLQHGDAAKAFSGLYNKTLGALSFYWSQKLRALEPNVVAFSDASHPQDYNDDNEWVLLSVLQREAQQKLSGRAALSNQVEGYDDIAAQWLPGFGGVPWRKRLASDAPAGPVTVSTAPLSIAGAELAAMTNDETLLQQARTQYRWLRSKLLDGDGLFFDGFSPADGRLPQKYTYGQGVAAAAAYLAGDRETARMTIAQTLRHFDGKHSLLTAKQSHDAPITPNDLTYNALFFKWAPHALMPNDPLHAEVNDALLNAVQYVPLSNQFILAEASALQMAILAAQLPQNRKH